MFKNFILIIILIFFYVNNIQAQESLLTLKQQIDRLQREVSDISKSINKKSLDNQSNNLSNNLSGDLTAFDLRIYDLEKDIKKLNANLEEIIFQIDDLKILFQQLDSDISKNFSNKNNTTEVTSNISEDVLDKNSLGSLKISSEDLSEKNNQDENINSDNIELEEAISNLKPEEEFQIAFDLLRNQKFNEAQIAFINFIKNNESDKLSGSAHYWLGELYILKKNYREAALILAEGYQKHSSSIKAPEILYKLSLSLININKIEDACSTLKKLTEEFPSSNILEKAKKKITSENCTFNIE